MEEYQSNSHKSREAQQVKKVERVINGSAHTKKKSEMKKFVDTFVQEDAGNIATHILMDVLAPAIKKALSDIVKDGIDMLLYGDTTRSRKGGNSSHINYGRYYEEDREKRTYSNGYRNGFDYDDIAFETRGDAEMVLDSMNEIIDQYQIVSVADLYDLAGVPSNNYTANKYGWTNIDGTKIVRVREDYFLRLPRAVQIS